MEHSQDDIGILKSIWRKDPSGTWSIHDLQSIALTPKDGFSRKFFRIKNEFHMMTKSPGPIFENLFATFGFTEFLLRQSIVPVVAWNDGDEHVRCIGTGFFISASGLLMTAAHVLRDPVDEEYTTLTQVGERMFRMGESLRMGVLLPTNPAMKNAPFAIDERLRSAKSLMLPIEWATHWGQHVESPLFHEKPAFKLDLDIAICKIRDNPIGGSYQPLNLGLHKLSCGDRAVAIGYAEMNDIKHGAHDYEPELTVSVGTVTAIYPDNLTEKQNPTPGPNFEFDAKIPGKMSGSPILVGGGILTKGVVSRSWQNENHASGCLIAPIMKLPLQAEKSLLDLMRSGKEGIAQFRGPNL